MSINYLPLIPDRPMTILDRYMTFFEWMALDPAQRSGTEVFTTCAHDPWPDPRDIEAEATVIEDAVVEK